MKYTLFWMMLLIGFVLIARIVPHPANFSPLTALLIFIPVFFPKHRLLVLAPFVGMTISDMLLGGHSTWAYVYGSFGAILFLGRLYTRYIGIQSVVVFPFFSSILFFLVTNFGVWQTTTMYTKDLNGLMQAYAMGIPFWKTTLAGDLFYVMVFSSMYALLSKNIQKSVGKRRDTTSLHQIVTD